MTRESAYFPAIVTGLCFLFCTPATQASVRPWEFHDHTLDNGLRVITMEDHSAPIAAVQIWYHVGSKDENPERQGFAHMFEHMMFRGTERIGPEDHFKYLRKYGGQVNGYTTFDATVYVQEIPANQVALTFWLEAERMANLKINEDYFAKEREVVKEEYRLRVADPPYGGLFPKVFEFVFKEHPYRWTPIGNLKHLNAATAEELRKFFDTYYVPNNATVVVVGDIKHDEVLAQAKKYFGWIPRSAAPPRISSREPEMTEPRRFEYVEPVGPLPAIGLGYHVCPDGHADSYALKVLQEILAGGQSTRIHKHLVKGREMFTFATATGFFLEHHGVFALGGVLKLGGDLDKAEQALLAEIDALLEFGVSEKELLKVHNNLLTDAFRDRSRVSGIAQRLGYAAVVLGSVEIVNQELTLLMEVTREDVQRVAKKYFTPSRRMTLHVIPLLSKLNPFKGLFGGKKKAKDGAGEGPPAKE